MPILNQPGRWNKGQRKSHPDDSFEASAKEWNFGEKKTPIIYLCIFDETEQWSGPDLPLLGCQSRRCWRQGQGWRYHQFVCHEQLVGLAGWGAFETCVRFFHTGDRLASVGKTLNSNGIKGIVQALLMDLSDWSTLIASYIFSLILSFTLFTLSAMCGTPSVIMCGLGYVSIAGISSIGFAKLWYRTRKDYVHLWCTDTKLQ